MKRYLEQAPENPARRHFLQVAAIAGGGFAIGFGAWLQPADAAAGTAAFAPNAFVRIGRDGTVTVVMKHLEMGQGVSTGLPTLVAEELDADWNQVRFEAAPADASRYNNLLWGPAQGTGGSSAIANSWDQLRQAGAAARALLVAAAARQWKVPEAEIGVDRGVVSHPPSGRKAGFGELANAAAKLPVPKDIPLKDPKTFKLIGTRLPRKDSAAKTDGSALYTIDVKLPGLLTALVAHPPRFGARMKSLDAARARAFKGVVEVVQIPTGVAVLAEDFWTAKQARDALAIQWDEAAALNLGTAEILARYRELAGRPGAQARKVGDAEKALAGAAKTLEAEYEFPYLAHATLEPMNCVVKLDRHGCEIWNGEQMQTGDQMAVAAATGLKPEQVRLNMLYAGGSFGRRANTRADYILEAVSIAQALAGTRLAGRPVKLQWTREDDLRAGYYRPMYLHRLRAGLDGQNRPVAWHQRIVGQSIFAGTPYASLSIKDGIDQSSVEGAVNLPYRIPDLWVDLHSPEIGVPAQWWRSVGSTHTAFSTETFIDELAALAGRDPVEFRRALLADQPRHLAVLNLAAEKAGWGTPLTKGKGRGIAVHESFRTCVAQVAEVAVAGDGSFRVERVVCAVDCGLAVNPDVVRAQMEGGIGFGLSAALAEEVKLDGGRVVPSNFHDYPVLRIDAMPKIEVHIVPSGEKPTGVGEPGTPVIAPAVANALHAATGKRLRKLPLSLKA